MWSNRVGLGGRDKPIPQGVNPVEWALGRFSLTCDDQVGNVQSFEIHLNDLLPLKETILQILLSRIRSNLLLISQVWEPVSPGPQWIQMDLKLWVVSCWWHGLLPYKSEGKWELEVFFTDVITNTLDWVYSGWLSFLKKNEFIHVRFGLTLHGTAWFGSKVLAPWRI